MYTHAYDAKVVRLAKHPDGDSPMMAALEVDLGFRVWKIQHIVLDESCEEMDPGTMVRVQTRLEKTSNVPGAAHFYLGRIKRL